METVKVAGHGDLVKDLQTQAVINFDTDAFKEAVKIKEKRLAELKRVDELEDKINRLETLVETLLRNK